MSFYFIEWSNHGLILTLTDNTVMEKQYPRLAGFHNVSESCYIDSLLIAMFGPFIVHIDENANQTSREMFSASRPKNDFWRVMLQDNVDDRITDFNYYQPVCDLELNEDMKIRREIQKTLRIDVDNLIKGQRKVCSQLRTLLGRNCRLPMQPDLSRRSQDPADVYERLLNVFAYSPIWFHEKNAHGYFDRNTKKGIPLCAEEERYTRQMKPSTMIYADVLRMYSVHGGDDIGRQIMLSYAWRPQNWEPVKYEPETVITCGGQKFKGKNLPTLKYVHNFYDYADVFVVRLNRGDPADRQNFERPVVVPDDILLSDRRDFDGVPPEFILQGRGQFSHFLKAPQRYQLLSAIIHFGRSKNSAHYVTLLRVPNEEHDGYGDSWYMYDDMNPEPAVPVRNADAQNLLDTRSVMLFYFPYGPRQQQQQGPAAAKTTPKRARALSEVELESMEEAFDARVNAIVAILLEMGYDPAMLEEAATDVVVNQKFTSRESDIEQTLNRLMR